MKFIEQFAGSGRTNRNSVDGCNASARKDKETVWMLNLETVFLYGNRFEFDDSVIGKHIPKYANITTGMTEHSGKATRTLIVTKL